MHWPPRAAPGASSLCRASQAEFPPRSEIRQVGNRQLRKLQGPCDLRKHRAWEVNKLLLLSASHFFTRRHLRSRGRARGSTQPVEMPAQAPRPQPSWPPRLPDVCDPELNYLTLPSLHSPIYKGDHKNLYFLACQR